ncbi:MAG: hypothetical protein DDT24_00365 [Chloroflexi bacterium]|nr:hypothetical protein [Chloroflexota bacterium]
MPKIPLALSIRCLGVGLAEIGHSSNAECEATAGLHWMEDHLLVENAIRSFDELGDEFKIRLTTDAKTGIAVVTIDNPPQTRYNINENSCIV